MTPSDFAIGSPTRALLTFPASKCQKTLPARPDEAGGQGGGNFLPWIEAEFPFSHRTATKWMQVAKVYGSKLEGPSNLSSTAIEVIEELVAPKTPIEVREEVERMIVGRSA